MMAPSGILGVCGVGEIVAPLLPVLRGALSLELFKDPVEVVERTEPDPVGDL